ncbi:hypothetical protein ES705_06818 [subsurface metagenome]
MGNMGDNIYIHDTKDHINQIATARMKLFPKGAVLFTKSGMSILLNQRAILSKDMFVVSHIGVALSLGGIPSEWLYYWLKTIDFKKFTHATTLPSLQLSKVKEMQFPLPPLPEQHRIVAKIEELFTKLNAGIEALKKIKAQLKRYRQAVLKHAFEGKLTAKWRLPAGRQEKNGVEIVVENFSGKPIPKYKKHFVYVLESEDKTLYKGYTTDLRRRIKEHIEGIGSEWTKTHYPVALIHFEEFADEKEAIEKEQYFKSGIGREWLKEFQKQKELEYDIKVVLDKIKKERKNQLGKKYKELPPIDTTDLPELPEEWVWATLSHISQIILGQSPPSSTYNENQNGLPFYQGKLDFGELYPNPRIWCSIPKKIAEKGDVLISVRAPVGPTNLCPAKSCIGRGLAAVRGLSGIGPMFLLYLIRTFENVISGKGTGTTFNAITGDQLRTFVIPLPPLLEQKRIVEEIQSRLSVADEIEKVVDQSLKQAERLRQSILKRAFEGKLVPQDPNDEPASELLERIRAEKAKDLYGNRMIKTRR